MEFCLRRHVMLVTIKRSIIFYVTIHYKTKTVRFVSVSYTRSKLALRLMGLKGIIEKGFDFDERMSANK